jgi:glycine/D-amino acid oxidase-like deaminating enzyme
MEQKYARTDVALVGGGISGLTAACFLALGGVLRRGLRRAHLRSRRPDLLGQRSAGPTAPLHCPVSSRL